MKNNKPEYGKQYALTGGKEDKCIMNGNSWEESEVKNNKSASGMCICGCHDIISRSGGCPDCKSNHKQNYE